MPPRLRSAFTLIELLLVFSLIALIAGMMMAGLGAKQAGVQVRPAAEELAGVLRRARSLTISTMRPHAVVFNIANAGGSSGRILNNLEGGHWYRLLGPLQSTADTVPSFTSDRYYEDYANFGDFLDAVDQSWLGEPHVLPAGKVRFLALTDTDEGKRFANQMSQNLVQAAPALSEIFYASSGEAPNTYPRPWFGYYGADNKLNAWGGYDPANTQTRDFAGFCFQGGLTAILDSRNPADKAIVSYPAKSSRGFFDPKDGTLLTGASKKTRTILTKGEVRPLVNAAWRDAAIVFLPDGRAQMLSWNEARARYYDCDPYLAGRWLQHGSLVTCPNYVSGHTGWSWNLNSACGSQAGGLSTYQGVAAVDSGGHTCPPPPVGSVVLSNPASSIYIGGTWSKVRNMSLGTRVEETGTFQTHTGGWFFTLGPDIPRTRVESGANDNVFASADEALRSMLPAVRVFVSKAGLISIIPVARRDQMLSGLTTWPPTTWSSTDLTYWNNTSTTFNANQLAMDMRWGWLHTHVAQVQNGTAMIPRGVPIVHSIGTEMLTKRIWWVDQTWTEP